METQFHGTGTGFVLYPCDYGTGVPCGYHNFQSHEGVICCTNCGKHHD